jgi:hypothetical protein
MKTTLKIDIHYNTEILKNFTILVLWFKLSSWSIMNKNGDIGKVTQSGTENHVKGLNFKFLLSAKTSTVLS